MDVAGYLRKKLSESPTMRNVPEPIILVAVEEVLLSLVEMPLPSDMTLGSALTCFDEVKEEMTGQMFFCDTPGCTEVFTSQDDCTLGTDGSLDHCPKCTATMNEKPADA